MGTQRRFTRSVQGAAVLGVLVLSLTGCSTGDEDQVPAQAGSAEGRSASTPDSAEADPDIESTDDEGPDDDGAAEDVDDAALASGTECLVGTWLADNENVGAVLQQAAGDVNVAAPTGEVFISYSADGRHTVTYQAWTFEMSQDGVTVQVVRDGTDEGTYQANEDGHLTATDTDMGSMVSMTTPVGTHSTPGEPSTMTGTFTCQGSTLEITVDGDTSVMTRQ